MELAQGLEFNVYKATSPTHNHVVLRVPKFKVFQNASDPNIDAGALVRQEAAILALLALLRPTAVPVPRCHGIYEVDGYPAIVCEFMAAGSVTAAAADDDAVLGRVAALSHATPIPADWAVELVAMEGFGPHAAAGAVSEAHAAPLQGA